MNDCILLRYGEVGLKSKRTRIYYERAYIKSIKDALLRNKFNKFDIENFGGRFVVYCDVNAVDVLKRVAGVQSLSPASKVDFKTKKDLIENVAKLVKKDVANKTFAIRIKRVGNHDFKSIDIAKELGSALIKESNGVNLSNPEAPIHLEIRNKNCFVYTESIKGLGGMPLNNADKVLCLFSGGIDSPVAALQMIKRGCRTDFLFVNIIGDKLLSDVAKIYNFLSTRYVFGYKPKLFVVDGKKIIAKLKKEVPDTLRQLAYKIVLYKIGEAIARNNKYLALVSGEALSQKSSQTLASLLFIEREISIPMLRPLIAMDKIDIVKIAQDINTMSMSEKIKEYCNLSTGPVTVNPREQEIKKIPDFDKEIKEAVKEVMVNRGLLIIEDPEPIKLGKKIISVDIREKIVKKNVPLKTDKAIPYSEIFKKLNSFDKKNSYLFICEFGVRSEDVAYELRKKGIKTAGVSIHHYLKFFKK